MSRIKLQEEGPGIVGLIKSYPRIGDSLRILANNLLRGAHFGVTVLPWEREYIVGSCGQVTKMPFIEHLHFAVALILGGFDSMDKMHAAWIHSRKRQVLEVLAQEACVRPSQYNEVDVLDALSVPNVTQDEVHLVTLIGCAVKMYAAYIRTLGNNDDATPEQYQTMAEKLTTKGYS